MANLIHLAIPAFVLLMMVEAIADAIMRRDLYEIKDTAASITMGLGSVVVGLGTKAMQLSIFGWIYRFRTFDLGDGWWVWILLFFADEFSYYWFHRTSINAACSGPRTSSITRRSTTTCRPLCARVGRARLRGGFSGCGCHWSVFTP
jgi:hypothetical protein